MHIHILGICGTFMGGIAALARAAGHEVSGSDRNVYPPMSTQLAELGIELVEGYGAEQLSLRPDLLVVGNVMTRGMPVIEAMLDRDLPYVSGPAWLAEQVLRGRWVLAVAGTHGKTTTSSMLAWILAETGLDPGFLIGGVPLNFGISARLGSTGTNGTVQAAAPTAGQGAAPFVIEADEYDTAFFDKRAKFVYYRPRTLVLSNLEFDHADIYQDLAAIERQFQHLVRTVPGSGRILCHAGDDSLTRVLAAGCWTPLERFEVEEGRAGEAAGEATGEAVHGSTDSQGAPLWRARAAAGSDYGSFEVLQGDRSVGQLRWDLIGAHNAANALAALAAAQHFGVPAPRALAALGRFQGVARRMQLRGEVGRVRVYDDFAHHPTAIAATLAGLRRRIGRARLVAVLEPRSASMRMGVYRDTLGAALGAADEAWLYAPPDLGWDVRAAVEPLGARAHVRADLDGLLGALAAQLRAGDHVLLMSNGGFGGLHARLLQALTQREQSAAAVTAQGAGGHG